MPIKNLGLHQPSISAHARGSASYSGPATAPYQPIHAIADRNEWKPGANEGPWHSMRAVAAAIIAVAISAVVVFILGHRERWQCNNHERGTESELEGRFH